jgi:CRP-like cAMP-binding protein
MFSSGRKPISLRKAGVKEERTQIMIRFYFSNSFLFRDFDEQEQTFLIDSMVPEHTDPNQKVISEGEFGDCMYFIEEGFFECSLNGEEQEDRNSRKAVQFLKNYQAGDTFGELCLLHRARRQATVTSKTEGTLLSLSREAYSHVHKMSIGKRRSSYV